VSQTKKKVLLDRIEKVVFEMTAGGAPSNIINHLLSWHQAIEKGAEPYKWLNENPMPEPMMPGPEGAMMGPGPGPEGGVPPEALPPGAAPPGNPAPAIANVPSPEQIMALAAGRR
jgi:hypothetical protein